VTTPNLGERVLLVPQVSADLMNPHVPNLIGKHPHVVSEVKGSRALDFKHSLKTSWWPEWTTFTSTLVRKGFGVMVVRDGRLEAGPSDFDSGD
jgi:hypothetical protein